MIDVLLVCVVCLLACVRTGLWRECSCLWVCGRRGFEGGGVGFCELVGEWGLGPVGS